MAVSFHASTMADDAVIRAIHLAAFGQTEEADLTAALMLDPTAMPRLSLVAQTDQNAVAHILFSRVRIAGANPRVRAAILCPLAVVPDVQGQGIGSALVRAALKRLNDQGYEIVFVFGAPLYYQRFGFCAAKPMGYPAPYSVPTSYEDGWMMRTGSRWTHKTPRGAIVCCEALSNPVFWSV